MEDSRLDMGGREATYREVIHNVGDNCVLTSGANGLGAQSRSVG